MSDIESDVERRDDTGSPDGVQGGGEPNSQHGRPAGRPSLVAFGFLLAFAATVLTVILTGLMLRRG